MKVSFVIESTHLDLSAARLALGREPTRVNLIGDRILNSSKFYDRNIYTIELCDTLSADVCIKGIHSLINDNCIKWDDIFESYKYFDITVEKDSVFGDIFFSPSLFERLRILGIQLQFDIPNY